MQGRKFATIARLTEATFINMLIVCKLNCISFAQSRMNAALFRDW